MKMMIYSILSIKRNSEKLKVLLAGMKGVSEVDLYTVSFSDIAAVVSDVERANLITDKKNAIEYAGVIETLSQQFTLLPVRFGSILESNDALMKMLERNYNEIKNNLQKVENKFEFGLKVFCDSEKLMAELKSQSEAVANTSDKPAPESNNSVFRDWVNKKLKEHRLEESLLSYVDLVIATLKEHLVRLNAVNKFKKMTSAITIIDAVFLLEKERKDALIHVIADLQNQHPGLNFVLTGPWPPYNFVDITIK
jgi:hypothetical protein